MIGRLHIYYIVRKIIMMFYVCIKQAHYIYLSLFSVLYSHGTVGLEERGLDLHSLYKM